MACSNPECRRTIRELRDQLFRVRSAGYDMLKQRGSWQSCGQTHHHLSLGYEEFFAHEAEDTIEALKESSVPEDQARKRLCNVFQNTFERCKETILERMKVALSKVLSVGLHDDDSLSSAEEMYDVCRAYGLLLHACRLGNQEAGLETPEEKTAGIDLVHVRQEGVDDTCAPQLPNKLTHFTKAASDLSWNLLTTVPPLVCAQPETAFCKECHEKEMKPVWDDSLGESNLEYYRPTLFLSYEGRVARRGWVGNRKPTPVVRSQGDGPSTQPQGGAPTGLTGLTTAEAIVGTEYSEGNLEQQQQDSVVTEEVERLGGEVPTLACRPSRPCVAAGVGVGVSGEKAPTSVDDFQAQKCPLHSGKEGSLFASLGLSGRSSKDATDGILPSSIAPSMAPKSSDTFSGRSHDASRTQQGTHPKAKGRSHRDSRSRERGGGNQGADDRFSLMHVWLFK